MSRPVSAIVPSFGDRELLADHLPSLVDELARRDVGDEIVVVDDGAGGVDAWLAERFADAGVPVRCVVRAVNGGFAAAVADGLASAAHELVLLWNPDVRARPGFLEPLVRALEEDAVAAAAPFVLVDGERAEGESLARLAWDRGFPALELADVDVAGLTAPASLPAALALGGASLWRAADLVGDGAFDPLFAPFYWEDIDRCWRAWRAGRRVVVCTGSVVLHHFRGTIGRVVPDALVRAAIEKNRLLFAWKHVDDEARIAEHLDALQARIAAAAAREDRDALVWLCLALEQAEEALAGRDASTPEDRRFDALRRASDAGLRSGRR